VDTREDQSALEFTQASLLRIIEDSLDLRFGNSMEDTEWDFWDAALEVRLIDGVAELLAFLHGRQIRMGVISNSSFAASTLERELQRQGIRRYFEFVISSADYGIRKPDPIIFEVALARLGLGPASVWFAGDNVGYDVVGARNAGIFPIAFRPRVAVPDAVGEHATILEWEHLSAMVR